METRQQWPDLQVKRADGHPSGSVRTGSGASAADAAARAPLEHTTDGGRPILPLDASPLASAMSTCAALMDLLGNPFVDPATSRGSWHASPDSDPLPSVRQTRRHKLQRPSVTRLAR